MQFTCVLWLTRLIMFGNIGSSFSASTLKLKETFHNQNVSWIFQASNSNVTSFIQLRFVVVARLSHDERFYRDF